VPAGTRHPFGEVLDRRSLNRALLARQPLLGRIAAAPEDEVEHLVGMQAQSPQAPYVGLWTRLEAFDPLALSSLVAERALVRMTLMRGTIHLVAASDAFALRPVMQPVIDAAFRSSPWAKRMGSQDPRVVAEAAAELLALRPRTLAELRPLLADRFPGLDAESLAMAARHLGPLVQVPPRGLWRRAGAPAWATAESWLGRRPGDAAEPEVVEAVVLRYLAAFGPASVRDAQTWSWLTRLRPVFERLRARLRVFEHECGIVIF
jgi:hypothetical protein